MPRAAIGRPWEIARASSGASSMTGAKSPGLLDRQQRRRALRGPGAAGVEGTDRGASQRQAVGVAKRGDQRAHVGAGRSRRSAAQARSSSRHSWLELIHRDLALRGLHVLAAARAPRTHASPVDLHRREPAGGRWRITAERQLEHPREDAGRDDLALRVPRRGGGAERDEDLVGLRQIDRRTAASRVAPPDQHDQQPGGEGVERPGVPDPAQPERARGPAPTTSWNSDRAVRQPGGFRRGALSYPPPARGSRRSARGVGSSLEKPAAAAMPAAAEGARDRGHVDVVVGGSQRHLAPADNDHPQHDPSRISAATFVPSHGPQVVDDPPRRSCPRQPVCS